MNNPVILHVNFVEQGQSIPEMCRLAVAWGYDGVEFRRKRSQADETPEQYLDSIAREAKQAGLKHILFGGPGPNLMSSDAAVRQKEIDECIAFYRAAAKRFPLTVCNTMTGSILAPGAQYHEYNRNGSAAVSEEQWQWAVEGFQVLGDLAAEIGFGFAFETHNCYLHDLPDVTRRLVDRIGRPSVGTNFDYGNIILHPTRPSLEQSIAACGDTIKYLHLKNLYLLPGMKYQNHISCPLADGAIDNREFLRLMAAQSFPGPICIEAPRPGDRGHFAVEDLAYLKRLMAEV
ncbi:MAG: sugar phosphate isomerase/epimerase family protein [Armatimonadota bacterium]